MAEMSDLVHCIVVVQYLARDNIVRQDGSIWLEFDQEVVVEVCIKIFWFCNAVSLILGFWVFLLFWTIES